MVAFQKSTINWFDSFVVQFFGHKWPRINRWNASLTLPLFFAGMIITLVGLWFFPPLDDNQLFGDSLRYSLPLAALIIWRGQQLRRGGFIKGRPSAAMDLVGMSIMALFAFIPLSFGLESTLNGWLDQSDSSAHTTRVVGKWSSAGGPKGLPTYHAKLVS